MADIFFNNAGLDYDSADEVVESGDGRLRRNVYISPGEEAVQKLMPGNIYVAGGPVGDITYLTDESGNYLTTESGDYIVISEGEEYTYTYWGGCVSKDEDLVYYFLKDVGGKNALIEYKRSTEIFRKILWGEDKLYLDTFVHDCFYIDGWLYYNAGSYGLKKINTERAYYYTNIPFFVPGVPYDAWSSVRMVNGTYYKTTPVPTSDDPAFWTDSNWQFEGFCYPSDKNGDLFDTAFSLENIPPVKRIYLSYGSDTTKKVNNIRKKVFQFTYRWKYRDHGYSITAPVSETSLPIDDESVYGEILNSVSTNNYISLSIDLPYFSNIEYTELFFREGNTGNWKYLDRVYYRKEDEAGSPIPLPAPVFVGVYLTDESGNCLTTESGDYIVISGEEHTYIYNEGYDSFYAKYLVPYRFYNDKTYAVVDDDEINSLSDNVPKKANNIDFISENVLIAAAITEGFDNATPDVTLGYGTKEAIFTPINASHDNFTGGIDGKEYKDKLYGDMIIYWAVYYRKINIASSFSLTATGDIVTIDIDKTEDGVTYPHYLKTSFSFKGDSVTDFRDECMSAINTLGKGVSAYSTGQPTWMALTSGDFYLTARLDNPYTTYSLGADDGTDFIKTGTIGTSSINKVGDFKSGATHPMAIVYYDKEMRPFSALTEGMSLYIPTLPEINSSGEHNTYDEHFYVTWEIDHNPPAEARYYQWFYAGNTSASDFWQYVLDKDNPTVISGNYIKLNINPLQTISDSIPNTNIDPYTFQEGDRVRILTKAANVAGEYGDVLEDVFDAEIIKYEEDTSSPVNHYIQVRNLLDRDVIDKQITLVTVNAAYSLGHTNIVASSVTVTNSDKTTTYVEGTDYTIYYDYGIFAAILAGSLVNGQTILVSYSYQLEVGYSSLVEIYRPAGIASSGLFYYAMGDLYDISGGYHMGQLQDQTSIQGAKGVFDHGDCYFIARSFDNFFDTVGVGDNLLGVQSFSYSDFYDSNSYDKGKINVESSLGEITKNDIRWSNKLVVGTGINGLARFDALDYITLPDKYGLVQKTVQVGDVLKAYTPVKPIYVSIGRMEVYNAGGSSYLTYYDKVLGNFRIGVDDYGTENPESVIKFNNYVYGFDVNKGVFWRDAGNGLFPISGAQGSKYKMKTYFKNKTGISSPALTGIDRYLGMVFITIDGDTLGFSEIKDKWIAFYDFIPEGYLSAGDELYMFKSGSMYKNLGGTVNNFFGIQYSSIIDFFVNNNININKIFDTIEIDSNVAWDIPLIEVQNAVSYADATNKKMVSKIPASAFKLRENFYRAPFLRNMLTSSAIESEADLYEGELLRGTNLYIKMTTDTTDDIRLLRVKVNESVSKF